jgi:hypothetical protein
MTKDAAIRIVFTLQGLYTWTHSNRHQPRISRLSDETPVYRNRTRSHGTIRLSRVLGASSCKRSSRDCEASLASQGT